MGFEMCLHRLSRSILGQLLLAAFLAASVKAEPTQDLRNVKVGDQVPTFSVQGLDGASIDKATYQGKVLLLVFAKPNQEHSLKALRAVQRISKESHSTNLAVLAVSTKPEVAAESLKGLAAEYGLSVPMAIDPGRKMYGDFGLRVAPTTLLIDESGKLRFVLPHMPPSYERKLRIHTDLLLGKIKKEEHDALLADVGKDEYKAQDAFERRLAFAQTLVDQKKCDQAVPILTKLRSENKGSIPVAILLGTCYLAAGNVEEAAECLDPLSGRQPCPPKLELVLARLELRRGNEDKAENHLLDALKRSPEKGRVLYELGRLYERQGKLEQAVDCYRKALDEVFAAGS